MAERKEFKRLEMLLHGSDNPHGADIRCEHSQWMGEDLNHCHGIGEWKCMLKGYAYASDQYGIDSYDYMRCSGKDFNNCETYNKNINDSKDRNIRDAKDIGGQ